MGDSNIIEIKRIDTYNHNDIEVLSNLASSIVKQHYDSILGAEQNDYMIKMFQSVDAIKSQIENGYEYYMIFMGEIPVAFTAFYERTGKLYVSKFYVDINYRKMGISRQIFEFIKNEARKKELTAIFLNVNRYNKESIEIYEHFGFKKIGREKIDIGNGYFMDDFVMEYSIIDN